MMTPRGVNVEFAYAFAKFGCAKMSSLVTTDIIFSSWRKLEDFCDDAFDGFHVVLVGVEGFAEKLVDALFSVRIIRRDRREHVCG
jgi:hypothetical protein